MAEQLSQQEVAIVIQARKILKARGLAKDADVKTICQAAAISRKTGYEWASKLLEPSSNQEEVLRQEVARLQTDHEELKKRCDGLSFENEGLKLAWEIHGVNDLLAEKKKNTTVRRKRKRR